MAGVPPRRCCPADCYPFFITIVLVIYLFIYETDSFFFLLSRFLACDSAELEGLDVAVFQRKRCRMLEAKVPPPSMPPVAICCCVRHNEGKSLILGKMEGFCV